MFLTLKMRREWERGFRIKFERGEGTMSKHFQKTDKVEVCVESLTFIWQLRVTFWR